MWFRTLALALVATGLFGPEPTLEAFAQGASDPRPPELPASRIERLSNGLRLIHLPPLFRAAAPGDTVDVAFGYAVGLRARKGYPPGTAAAASGYLAASVPARTAALAAHLGGGVFGVVEDPELIGMRLTVPRSALEPVLEQIAAYLSESTLDAEILDYALRAGAEPAGAAPDAARREVYEAVGRALLGERGLPDLGEWFGDSPGEEALDPESIRRFFREQLGTDRAYVIASERLPPAAVEAFEAVEPRASEYAPPLADASGAESSELEFPSRAQGGMILAAYVPSVHFEGWFDALTVDRLLRRSLRLPARFVLGRSLDPSFHWIEVPVEIPDFPEDARNAVIERLSGFAFGIEPELLATARREALDYLAERETQEWFAAHGLSENMRLGWSRIWNLSPPELASAVQSFSAARRVAAMWSPAFLQPAVVVESLNDTAAAPEERETPRAGGIDRAPGGVRVPPLGESDHGPSEPVRLERLGSGVTLARSDSHGLFLAGRFDGLLTGGRMAAEGTNGTLWLFEEAPGAAVLDELKAVRPERLLFFVPQGGLPAARARFENWTGGEADSTASLAVGEVATIDMPGILVLKTWLEAKLIEAGWWELVELRVEGIDGARLVIDAEPERAGQVRAWIEAVASDGIPEAEFLQVRAAAMRYFARARRELQIILWQRAPEGAIQPPNTVTLKRLRDIAGIYF